MSTKAISLKLPTELLDRLKAKAEATGTTVTALLIEGVTGDGKPTARVAELEAMLAARDLALDTVTRDRDQWRDRAKAIVAAKPATSNAEARRMAMQHAAGPVLQPTGLPIAGTTRPMFKRSAKVAD